MGRGLRLASQYQLHWNAHRGGAQRNQFFSPAARKFRPEGSVRIGGRIYPRRAPDRGPLPVLRLPQAGNSGIVRFIESLNGIFEAVVEVNVLSKNLKSLSEAISEMVVLLSAGKRVKLVVLRSKGGVETYQVSEHGEEGAHGGPSLQSPGSVVMQTILDPQLDQCRPPRELRFLSPENERKLERYVEGLPALEPDVRLDEFDRFGHWA